MKNRRRNSHPIQRVFRALEAVAVVLFIASAVAAYQSPVWVPALGGAGLVFFGLFIAVEVTSDKRRDHY